MEKVKNIQHLYFLLKANLEHAALLRWRILVEFYLSHFKSLISVLTAMFWWNWLLQRIFYLFIYFEYKG